MRESFEKGVRIMIGRVHKQSQKGQGQKKSEKSSRGTGEVNKKGEILQKRWYMTTRVRTTPWSPDEVIFHLSQILGFRQKRQIGPPRY